MPQKKKTKPILLIDSREQHPWGFGEDEDFDGVERVKLDAGDYSIKGLEHVVMIERKANQDEIYTNFASKDGKRRLYAEFERAQDIPFKFIIVESSLEDVMNPQAYFVNKKGINKRHLKMPVAVVTSNLTNLTLQRNVHVIYGGECAASMAKGLLLRVYDLVRLGKLEGYAISGD